MSYLEYGGGSSVFGIAFECCSNDTRLLRQLHAAGPVFPAAIHAVDLQFNTKLLMTKKKYFTLLTVVSMMTIFACKKEDSETPALTHEQQVEASLNSFVSNLAVTPPTPTDLSNRIRQYLQANPSFFYGSTVTLLDSDQIATDSPYWYRSGDSMLVTMI